MAQKVQILPDKVQPSLNPPKGTGDSKHPNAPVRLRSNFKFKSNPTVRDRGKRS